MIIDKKLTIFSSVALVIGVSIGALIAGFGMHHIAKTKAEQAIFDSENIAMVIAATEKDTQTEVKKCTLDHESKTLWLKTNDGKLIMMKPKEIHPYYYQWVEVNE